jgi:hypothetical protein
MEHYNEGNPELESSEFPRRKQTREVLSVKQRAALRKIERLNYILEASCYSPVVRRVVEAMEFEREPETRVQAAVRALRFEQKAGRDSDFVRACLGSLQYCDERDLVGAGMGVANEG